MRISLTKPETAELDPSKSPPEFGATVRDTALSTLLSSARHELRSPLQSIQGFAELLDCGAYGRMSAEQQTFVKHILQGSNELGAFMEACLELTELAILGRPTELTREHLADIVTDSFQHAVSAGVALPVVIGQSARAARARIDAPALRRALEALVSAVSVGGHRDLHVELDVEGELGYLRVRRPDADEAAPLCTIEELAQHRRNGRALIWLQLASMLIAKQDGLLTAAESGARAEVRLKLSSTH